MGATEFMISCVITLSSFCQAFDSVSSRASSTFWKAISLYFFPSVWKEVADMLDRFQIVGKKDLFPEQLSGGQQQLVGIARTLVARPQLLLADEPTGNLNSKQGEEIMQLFKQLNEEEGITIIQVTHSEKNAGYGSRIIHLLDGRIEKKD